ncbi:MAG: asparagine synthase (glutamine-hydrolyzing), partial [Bacteroidia bacterium]|nr:asparagine synthase (glutamine-hydrolyzing) [Bacteroidia bacterium]
MCGIIGWVGRENFDEKKFWSGLRTLSRRGPDRQAVVTANGAILGHARLSILDLSPAADQPMRIGPLILVYNGEVFNYKEIAAEIQRIRPEVRFQSTGDAEVVLRAYETWGKTCVEKFNGFFAFAIYDENSKTLFAARDSFGIKPFWYVHDEKGFFFASEAKALFGAGYNFEMNPISVYHYFQLNYVPPDTTLWYGAYKLLPGKRLLLRNNQLNIESYIPAASPPGLPHPQPSTYLHHQENIFFLIENAVKIRLISDVPLGVFLSGGTDSSIIAAMAARHKPDLMTFSIGFDDPLFDETHYAELTAKFIGSNHTSFKLSFEDLAQGASELLDYLDEPFADAS